jgi:hypothetical protein
MKQTRRYPFQSAYGAARPTADVWKQFASARHETTLQAQSHWTRDSLRRQARQEFETNQHAGGIARLFGLYVVGVGPRLKFKGFPKYLRKPVPSEFVDYVNYRWEQFADDIQFASTLRNAMETMVVDGDAFLFFGANPRKELGIDLRLLDSQRIGNPDGKPSSRTLQDGVYLDAWGNPIEYCVYDVPDTEGSYYRSNAYRKVGASQIFHLFRSDLPGQTRGISWFASALPLLQQLREYTAAVVESAKVGARFVATIETQQGFSLDDFNEVYALPGDGIGANVGASSPDDYAPIPYDAWGTFHTTNGDSLVLPPGTTQKGFNPSQPTAEASSYTANILSQIGYSMGLPRNKATGSSHEYNFASGSLDNQPFEMLIKTLQLDLFERRCCDQLFKYFYQALEPELLGLRVSDVCVPSPDEVEWEWVWPSPPLVDAESTARTNAIKLKSLQTTLSEIWNDTHAFSEFDDVREQIKRDQEDFPNAFGLAQANTAIGEPTAPPVSDPTLTVKDLYR